MIEGLIGTKKGMTELFLDTGEVVPTTIIQAGPCYVVDKKTIARDGYNSVKLGYTEIKPQRANKAMSGIFKKSGVPPLGILKEFGVTFKDDVPSLVHITGKLNDAFKLAPGGSLKGNIISGGLDVAEAATSPVAAARIAAKKLDNFKDPDFNKKIRAFRSLTNKQDNKK